MSDFLKIWLEFVGFSIGVVLVGMTLVGGLLWTFSGFPTPIDIGLTLLISFIVVGGIYAYVETR